MPARHLPVRPDLEQLRHQARDLLREHRLSAKDPASVRLADAQLALARSYGVASWPRLVLACKLIDAIWEDDVPAARALIGKHPRLLHEMARATRSCNWGPPMSYAANLGRDRMIAMFHERGATDLDHAMDRAVLQGKIDTARKLIALGASAVPPPGAVLGPAETLSVEGMRFALERGAAIADAAGNRLAPVALVLETYARRPAGKHAILQMFVERGIALPDTPALAVHRGRIDLLEAHVSRDPALLARTFSHAELWPPALGCQIEESGAPLGTPLAGGTLLHLCADYEEVEIARWLLERGMDPDARAVVDAGGFGGHTALFHCVVPHVAPAGPRSDGVARLLLDHGADPNARASLRWRRYDDETRTVHEHQAVTPLGWAAAFDDPKDACPPAMRLIAERGGRPA
jgi:hypothetical protein